MSSDDLLNEAAASAATVSPEKMAEVKEILAKMQAGLADMTDEEKEEFRQGFVHKLAEKVRGAAAAEAERGVADMGYGFFLTFSSFLIVLILFGLVGYKIYQFVNEQEARKNAKGRTKSLKKSKRKEK